MFRKIMVPLDGSDRAERALPVAVQLTNALGAALHLVRVDELLANLTSTPLPPYLPEGAYEADLALAKSYLTSVYERLSRESLLVRMELLTGSAPSALLDYELAADIDLLVMCSHGRSGIARFTLGSVAERLLRYGAAPVLLVRSHGDPPALERAVVPLDGSARSEAALAVVKSLAGTVLREVTVLRVIGEGEDEAEAGAYLAAQQPVQPDLVWRQKVVRGDPAEAIIDVAGEDTLVIMATHGRTGLTRWALGSVADRVARGGVAGVLLARMGTRPAPAL